MLDYATGVQISQARSKCFISFKLDKQKDLWSNAVSSTVVNISSSLFSHITHRAGTVRLNLQTEIQRFANAGLDSPDDVDLVRSSVLSVEQMNSLRNVKTSYCSCSGQL